MSGVSGRVSALQAGMHALSGIDCCNAKESPPAKFRNGPAARRAKQPQLPASLSCAASKRRWARTAARACLMPTCLVLGGRRAAPALVLDAPSVTRLLSCCPLSRGPRCAAVTQRPPSFAYCERPVAAERRTAALVSPSLPCPAFLGRERASPCMSLVHGGFLTSEAIDTRPALCDAAVPSPGSTLQRSAASCA